ncbi:MAG: peptidylprolyl isomerase, partial [Candidatus Rokubacteria bacterium]|nr:peptidylprolyl isomerase [Candidatus Rokubacteria bacterium]
EGKIRRSSRQVMAQRHKAATQVTIAPTSDSPIREWVERVWKPAVVLALLAIAAVLGTRWAEGRRESRTAESWGRFREDVTLGAGTFGGVSVPSAAVLGGLAEELQGTVAGPWARGLEVHKLVADGRYDEAAGALQTLAEEAPDHPLVSEAYRFAEGDEPRTLSDHLLDRMDEVVRWEREHPSLFRNPPPPPEAPRVRLHTDRGAIQIGLYPEKASRHVENFLKLCREGFYDGTRFHRIGRTFMVQGGDPNSRDPANPESWGLGGPGYTIPPEPSDLRHFPYVLAAAKTATETESSGSQFYLTVGSPHHLDGVHTVFGTVLEGQAVVDEIAAGEIEAGTADRPRDPVVLRSTEVIESAPAPAGAEEGAAGEDG